MPALHQALDGRGVRHLDGEVGVDAEVTDRHVDAAGDVVVPVRVVGDLAGEGLLRGVDQAFPARFALQGVELRADDESGGLLFLGDLEVRREELLVGREPGRAGVGFDAAAPAVRWVQGRLVHDGAQGGAETGVLEHLQDSLEAFRGRRLGTVRDLVGGGALGEEREGEGHRWGFRHAGLPGLGDLEGGGRERSGGRRGRRSGGAVGMGAGVLGVAPDDSGQGEPDSQRTGWSPSTKGAPSTMVRTDTGKMASRGSRERMSVCLPGGQAGLAITTNLFSSRRTNFRKPLKPPSPSRMEKTGMSATTTIGSHHLRRPLTDARAFSRSPSQ